MIMKYTFIHRWNANYKVGLPFFIHHVYVWFPRQDHDKVADATKLIELGNQSDLHDEIKEKTNHPSYSNQLMFMIQPA
jgi:hypothetical protein